MWGRWRAMLALTGAVESARKARRAKVRAGGPLPQVIQRNGRRYFVLEQMSGDGSRFSVVGAESLTAAERLSRAVREVDGEGEAS